MKKSKINIATMQKIEISNCPYCGAEPVVTARIKSKNLGSDVITNQEVICTCCGLSAEIDIWEAICDRIDTQIMPNSGIVEEASHE